MTTNKLTDDRTIGARIAALLVADSVPLSDAWKALIDDAERAELQERRKADSQAQATLHRLAVILHGSEVDLNLLTVTAQSLMDRCKAATSSDL